MNAGQHQVRGNGNSDSYQMSRDWDAVAERRRKSNESVVRKVGRVSRRTIKITVAATLAILVVAGTCVFLALGAVNNYTAVTGSHADIERQQCSEYKESGIEYRLAQPSFTNGEVGGYVNYGDAGGDVWHPISVGGFQDATQVVELPEDALTITC